jgi:hypothetical protein
MIFDRMAFNFSANVSSRFVKLTYHFMYFALSFTVASKINAWIASPIAKNRKNNIMYLLLKNCVLDRLADKSMPKEAPMKVKKW